MGSLTDGPKDSLGLHISKKENGYYKIGNSRPVVVVIYIMKQIELYPKEADKVNDFDDPHSKWETDDSPQAYVK